MSGWGLISAGFGSEEDYLDPALGPDEQLRACSLAGRLDDVIAFLEPIVAATPTGDAPERLGLGYWTYVDGRVEPRDDMAALGAVLARAVELRDHPDRLPPEWPYRDAMLLPYLTDISDERLRGRATTVMLERLADRIDEQHEFAGGIKHLHFHADLGDELDAFGTVLVTANNPPLTLGVLPGQQIATTAATLTVERGRDGELVGRVRADLPFDTSVDERFPHLRHVFADVFGPTSPHPHFRYTPDVLSWMEDLKNPAFATVRDELDQLLATEDDLELRWTVENLGSWAMPTHIRYWLERFRWRFDAFDWDPDGVARWQDRSR